MAIAKMQYCFNCGKELGVYVSYHAEPESCGSTECERNLRYEMQAAEEERQERAREDGYSRY